MKLDTGTDEPLCEITQRATVVTLNEPHKKNARAILTPLYARYCRNRNVVPMLSV